MMRIHFRWHELNAVLLLLLLLNTPKVSAQQTAAASLLEKHFLSPPESSKPWVFWYWMHGAVSREGITADLQAMKQAGIGGAYLMPIKDTLNPPLFIPIVRQLSPAWWQMVKHAMTEAKRFDLKLAMHVSDGFALAGGPWITPEMSMQKIVWTEKIVDGGKPVNDAKTLTGFELEQPETIEGYYKDIAVFAFPSPEGTGITTRTIKPVISGSKTDSSLQLLATPGNSKNFNCDEQCWIQYAFEQPFTCRSIIVNSRNNYQSHRLIIEGSDDGVSFRRVARLQPPRHGWQDWDAPYTHVIPKTTARYFRFIYDKAGSEPGAEDLDAAKWRPVLKITGIELSSEPKIHQYEGKNGEVWRVSDRTNKTQLPDDDCLRSANMVNITSKLQNGVLMWTPPPGKWTILRMGHTSTGHTNATGGGAKGLECDKFNVDAVRLQFDSWIGETIKQVGPELAREVLKIFHVDSWECGSQNWSVNFRHEFRQRRGYDCLPFLPAMAGFPVGSADSSENFLLDVRQTIAELINDKFYVTLSKLAHEKGMQFSAESVAPTMVSDGLLHYKSVDIPMGEFWLRSPTHDKPNDMLDAISGAHIYGKNIIQAEGFTQLRMAWDEHPAMLKTLADRNFALGVNRLVYHVFTHNPWMDRKPGMTLDAIGLYFQRDQTWWKQAGAFVDYSTRCQALLQAGKPVADIAVFIGEDMPRRSLLPDRLVTTLPGIFGKDKVEIEMQRLSNKGQPLRTLPAGVTHVANMADPENWVNPLRGYAYDSFNPDALMNTAKVKNGRVEFAPGTSYGLLVFPGAHKMTPNGDVMSPEVAQKIKRLIDAGATVLINAVPKQNEAASIRNLFSSYHPAGKDKYTVVSTRKGKLVTGPYNKETFDDLGLSQDVIIKRHPADSNKQANSIAWTHRAGDGFDVYFLANQDSVQRILQVSLRVSGKIPELWDPLNGSITRATDWLIEKGRTMISLMLEPNGSIFIVFRHPAKQQQGDKGKWTAGTGPLILNGEWNVHFDSAYGGPGKPVLFNQLSDWSKSADSSIKYYSGTAAYYKKFNWNVNPGKKSEVWLNTGKVANIASVYVNGVFCGIAWTAPYRVNISKAIKKGANEVRIEVSNTWANRLIGDQLLPESKRITNTNSPYRLQGQPLLEAGLLGPVTVEGF